MLNHRLFRLAFIVVAATSAFSACESEKEAKAKFTAGANGKPFDKIEKNMCGEDIIERPEGWNERRDCNNEGKFFLDYVGEGRKDRCISLPAATSYECTAASFIKRAKELSDFDKELVKLYYASNDSESEFPEYEKNADAFLADQSATVTKIGEFIINCWEYEKKDDLGTHDIISMQAYFPNKATTNEKLGCTLYSNFVDYSPCMKSLKKINSSSLALDDADEDDGKITKTQKFGDDELISGDELDKSNDEHLEDCMSEG